MMVYCLNGTLPWARKGKLPASGDGCDHGDDGDDEKSGSSSGDDDDDVEHELDAIRMKESMSPEAICEGLPLEIATFLTEVRQRKTPEPQYRHYLNMFARLRRKLGYPYTREFDWGVRVYELQKDW